MKNHDDFEILEKAGLFLPDAKSYLSEQCVVSVDLPFEDSVTTYAVRWDKVRNGDAFSWELIDIKETDNKFR